MRRVPLKSDPTRTQRMITELAAAIANGEVTPGPWELEALAVICDDEQLPAEAARVRRWMEPAS